MTVIMTLRPYQYEGQWVFDDPTTGLVREAFVAGADTIIERMTESFPHAGNGFTLLFSATPFPGHTLTLTWQRSEYEGNWYYAADLGIEGWLCPALFKYFPEAPPYIYAQFKP